MAQRLIKVILPKAQTRAALDLLKEQEGLIYWQESTLDDKIILGALIDSNQSQSLIDALGQSFSFIKGFHLVVLPVEAILPRPQEELNGNDDRDAKADPKSTQETAAVPMRISREELYNDIVESSQLTRTFVAMTVLSTIVAAIGLLNNNVTVIIGAMVIAPFLGPNVALALSTNLGDFKLGRNALKTLLAGLPIALGLCALLGYWLGTDPNSPEIAARIFPRITDIVLALASGAAGVLAFTTGAPAVVIGVMVAVALLPPLATSGLLLGSGYLASALSAFLLFTTNVICINLAGIVTFFIQGISPRTWWEADRAKRATRTAVVLWSGILAVQIAIIYLWQR